MSFTQQVLIAWIVWLASSQFQWLHANEITFETVALTDVAAPGVPGAVNFSHFFNKPVINDAGQVLFRAYLAGAPVDGDNDFAIFSGRTGNLELLMREGSQVPGFLESVTFAEEPFFLLPQIDASGNAAFFAKLAGTGIVEGLNDTALFSNVNGNVEMVLLNGDSAPGLGAGVTFDFVQSFGFGKEGDISLSAYVQGPGIDNFNDQAVFTTRNGALDLVVQRGEQFPGMPPGVIVEELSSAVRINRAGQLAFRPNFNIGHGIFVESAGSFQPIALAGDQAPGAPLGVTFDAMLQVSFDMNELGEVALGARLTDGGPADLGGIFSNGHGPLDRLAITDQIAPDTEPGTVFAAFNHFPIINNFGDTLFTARLQGPSVHESNDGTVYLHSGGELKLVARQGQVAPATVGRVFDWFTDIWFNDVGQVAFRAFIDGVAIGDGNNEAIYLSYANQLHLIAREGDQFDVDDDPAITDYRTVSAVYLANGTTSASGPNVSLNNAGQLVFRLRFTDGTEGIFIANTPLQLGDINGDGNVDLLDVHLFVDALSNGIDIPNADINQDGIFNLLDVGPFVDLLAN